MSGTRTFVDTNVFAYALDGRDRQKQDRAQRFIESIGDGIIVSTQVLVELHAVCTRKLSMDRVTARAAVEAISAFPVVDTDRSLVLASLRLSESNQISIFDAAIVCAAQRAGCEHLATEDLNPQQQFEAVTIVNPFHN